MELVLKTLFSTEFIYSVIRVSTPLILATLAAVITSKAGITNIGIEGIMLISALVGVLASAFTGNVWMGLLGALVVGVLSGLAIGYASLHLKTDNVLTCIAFNLMAAGGTVFFMYAITRDKGNTMSLNSGMLPNLQIALIKNIPVIGEILSNHNIISYIAFAMIIVVNIILNKTSLGLRIRSAGESPEALASVGVSVIKVRYIALMISGFLSGLAGAYMSMGYVSWFSKNMTGGRGFIALAADAMGNSTPIGSTLAAMLFAIAEALSYRLQTTNIPSDLVQMVPYVTAIVGMIIYSTKKHNNKKRKIQTKQLS